MSSHKLSKVTVYLVDRIDPVEISLTEGIEILEKEGAVTVFGDTKYSRGNKTTGSHQVWTFTREDIQCIRKDYFID